MPQRTNDFQHLVKLIQQALLPAGAKVTESAMVEVPGFGNMREIDVLIETEVTPYRLKIAVEAKDHNRKLNITDIEAIVSKYRGTASVPVDKVAIVSGRGFARRAVEKAKANGFELFTLNEVSVSDWQRLVPLPFSTNTNHTMKFERAPHVARIDVTPGTPGVSANDAITRGKLICNCCGKDNGTPLSYANHWMTKHVMINPEFVKQFDGVFANGPNACSVVCVPLNKYRLVLDQQDYPVEAMRFHIHATRTSAPVELKAYEMKGESGSRIITRATAKFPGGSSLELVFPDGIHSKRVACEFKANCF